MDHITDIFNFLTKIFRKNDPQHIHDNNQNNNKVTHQVETDNPYEH